MGEVFKARDTRLDRSVAIKVLPAEFADNAQLKLRFEREAKTISQLSHPNICTVYDVGNDKGVEYIVMELVEGETLVDVLAHGRLPMEKVLRYGIEIAAALDRAHRSGIVHRDLKPGNIMITKEGAKLLDFGLAKSASQAVVMSGASAATEHKPLTGEGTIIGTLQYMAPEQLEAGEVDPRTDIFALGAVLYEMTTGKRAFDGKSRTSLMAAIIEREPPPMTHLVPLTPAAFEHVVKTCLAKDPEERWQTARDVLHELRWISEGSAQTVDADMTQRRRFAAAVAIALLAVVSLLFASLWLRARSEAPAAARIETAITAPPGGVFEPFSGGVAISPDGTKVVYAATVESKTLLWIRRLDRDVAHPVDGTESASYPFWSPDSRYLAFFEAGKLRRIDMAGGPPLTICDAPLGRGGAWGPDGTILLAPTARSPILRVVATGGTPQQLTRLNTPDEYSHRWPSFLPDGKHFLFLAQDYSIGSEHGRIYVGELGSTTRTPLMVASAPAVYARSGHILFYRDNSLFAQAFDATRLRLMGEPIPVAEHVEYFSGPASCPFSVSDNGTLVFQHGGATLSHLVIRNRAGKDLRVVGNDVDLYHPRVSHDGRRVAYTVVDDKLNTADVWVADLTNNTTMRLTFDPVDESNAVWSSDDRWIYYGRVADSQTRQIVRKLSSGAGQPEVILSTHLSTLAPTDMSHDDRFIVANITDPKSSTAMDVGLISLADKTVSPLIATDANESGAQISPDGHWVAYNSSESGTTEIYVQAFPRQSGKWQISSTGAGIPRWSHDGKELFFVTYKPKLKVTSVKLQLAATVETTQPVALFDFSPKGNEPFDILSDGNFLLDVPAHDVGAEPLTIVLNWAAGLK